MVASPGGWAVFQQSGTSGQLERKMLRVLLVDSQPDGASAMKVNAGLWIDHLKALIVITFDGGEKKLEILSHLEVQPARAGENLPRTLTGELNRFYTEVIGVIRDAEAILIFGPGEAKDDLSKHLVRACLADKIIAVEPADTMTDPQVAAKVRERFSSALAKLGTA
jgi:hypothetical protein